MRHSFILLALLAGPPALAGEHFSPRQCASQSSTPVINACAQQDYDAADRNLNAEYKKLRTRLPSASRATLLDQQRAWLKARDPRCKAALESEEGGTIWTSMYTTCLADATRERTYQLRHWKSR